MSRKNKKIRGSTKSYESPHPNHTHGAVVGALAGEVVGGIVGVVAGPPGIAAGMVFGAAAGALAGDAIDGDAARAHAHDAELDDAIGVTTGELGAPNLRHPGDRGVSRPQ